MNLRAIPVELRAHGWDLGLRRLGDGPEAGGEYGLTGQAADGTKLFSLDFQMASVADGGGESGLFVFALPVRPGWAGSLASLTLSAPGGSITMDEETDRPLAIFRHPQTGRVRAILRNLAPEVP